MMISYMWKASCLFDYAIINFWQKLRLVLARKGPKKDKQRKLPM